MQSGYLVQGTDGTCAFILITPKGLLHGPWSDTPEWADIDFLLKYDPDKQYLNEYRDSFDHVQAPNSYATHIITHFTDVSYVFEDYPEYFI